MYILVNQQNIIIGSAHNKPDESISSANGHRIYEIENTEFSPNMIGEVLEDFDIVERV